MIEDGLFVVSATMTLHLKCVGLICGEIMA